MRKLDRTELISAAEAVSPPDNILQTDPDEWAERCGKVRINCILLASGFSTRFSSNKLLADYRGNPMIAHTMAALKAADIAEVTVVTRYREVAELAEEYGIGWKMHDGRALSETIRAGIASSAADADGYMLCVADQPLLSAETLRRLFCVFAADPSRIIRPIHGDAPGNPVIFPASCRSELLLLEGEQGGRAVIRKHPDLLRYVQVSDGKELMDIDTEKSPLYIAK